MWANFVVKKILGMRGEKLKDYFDDLELELVIPQVLQYVFSYELCENVIWVAKEELQRRLQILKGIAPLEADQLLYRHLKIQGLKPYEDTQVDKILAQLPEPPAHPTEGLIDTQHYLLMPIMDHKGSEVLAYLIFTQVRPGKIEKLRALLSRDLPHMAKHLGYSLKHWAAQRMSFMDDLTHLYNQKYMSLVLENEIYRCQREQKKFSVLFMDVDYFKAVNDTRGHWVGSRLLIEIGKILKSKVRRSDYAFRYGGDEFVIVLPLTESAGAQVVAERLRSAVEQTEFVIDGEKIKLTLSIGLATYPDHAQSHKDIIKMADEAMYCGKNKSRNIVFVAS